MYLPNPTSTPPACQTVVSPDGTPLGLFVPQSSSLGYSAPVPVVPPQPYYFREEGGGRVAQVHPQMYESSPRETGVHFLTPSTHDQNKIGIFFWAAGLLSNFLMTLGYYDWTVVMWSLVSYSHSDFTGAAHVHQTCLWLDFPWNAIAHTFLFWNLHNFLFIFVQENKFIDGLFIF